LRKYNNHIISFKCLLFLKATVSAQVKPTPEYQLKAVFLYNFTHFIDWPPAAFESPDEPFVIGIIGNDPFGTYLEATVSGEKISNHPIAIKRYQDPKQIEHCQVLFISSGDAEVIKTILAATNNRNILTVSDADNFARMGGIIGFFTEKNKIRMQINSNAAKNAQLIISSKLLSVAQVL
jgi:hypothetical protein